MGTLSLPSTTRIVAHPARSSRRITLALSLILTALGLAEINALAADLVLVNQGALWHYRKGTNAYPTGWKTVTDSALDASWISANGAFGYADNTTETALCQRLLPDMKGKYSTVAFRKSFEVTSAIDATAHLILTMDYDDGFIAWLDGKFLASNNSPGSPAEPAHNSVATALHESSKGDSTRQAASVYDLGEVGARLNLGTHILAVVGLNQDLSSSDFIQVIDLTVSTNLSHCISGALTSNTTWHASDSPIEVCGTVTVAAGATLTIEPGTTVQFDSGVGLVVENGGRLLAEGTTNAPILFTRKPGQSNWDHLIVRGAPASPESRIAHARFEFNANSTGTPCIEVAAGTAFLDHLTFANTAAPYIHVDGASFIISDCHFPSATAAFELVHGTGGIKSGGHGLFQRNFFGSPIGYNDVVDFTGGNRPGPIIHFIDNVFIGSQDDGVDLDGTDAWVEGNIFLHVHRNGNTPDSSAAISGGNDGGRTSEITAVRNLFFDCDNAATAKQGNFFTFLNNTAVHITKTGGIDGGSGVVNVRDTTPSLTTFGRGYYLEGNIIQDVEQLVRNYDVAQTTVTLNNNILPMPWGGPGTNNLVADPLLVHIPQLSETLFTNWQQAQIIHQWFALKPGSPAIGQGPNGSDQGGEIPGGVSISGEPDGVSSSTITVLTVGTLRSGSGIPTDGWPEGSGYTHYKWRLDGGSWSVEQPIATPIQLLNLSEGDHQVDAIGKRDSGLYQDDPLFGDETLVSHSSIWTVQTGPRFDRISLESPGSVLVEFKALGGVGYTLQYRSSLTSGEWITLVHLDPIPAAHPVAFKDPIPDGTGSRFYRLAIP